MFIKLYSAPEVFKLFRAKDIISIDPVFTTEASVCRYEVKLANDQEDIEITIEQAHDLSLKVRHTSVFHPSQYE